MHDKLHNLSTMTASDLKQAPVVGEKHEPATPWHKRFTPILVMVGFCWAVFVVNNLVLGGRLNQFGIIPRRLTSLPGIFWAPFLHASFAHLAANTLPLLVLGAVICARSRGEFALVAAGGTVLSGALTWIFARNASHIGASGLIFCFFGYLASLAYFRRTFGTLVLSVACIIAYGGIIKGLMPTAAPISWEGHVGGFAAGILLAWIGNDVKDQKT